MKTSIVILTYNKLNYTIECIESIRRYTSDGMYEIIVVDNASTDGTQSWLKKQSDLKLILNKENNGFPKGCNQGIEVSNGDYVMLLNNDVVVTHNWLENLLLCLNSDKKIGVVGPITNSCSNYQSIEVPYETINEMHKFAYKYNYHDKALWEERLKLVGFCMLMKKEIIQHVGWLDERFTPGNYEDEDYSIRIRKKGYKLFLCQDTFVHHYGGVSFTRDKTYEALLEKNEKKFNEKWGFRPSLKMNLTREIDNLIDRNRDDTFKILEINCGCGSNLLYIKNKYPNSIVYGHESNIQAFENGFEGMNIFPTNPEHSVLSENVKFDYVIISNEIRNCEALKKILNNIIPSIKKSGRVILSIENPYYIDKIIGIHEMMSNMEPLNETVNHIKNACLTFNNLVKLISDTHFVYNNGVVVNVPYTKRQKEFLLENSLLENEEFWTSNMIKRYIVSIRFDKSEIESDIELWLRFLLRRIEHNINIEVNVKKLMSWINRTQDPDKLIKQVIESHIIDKVRVLNILGIQCMNEGVYDYILSFCNMRMI